MAIGSSNHASGDGPSVYGFFANGGLPVRPERSDPGANGRGKAGVIGAAQSKQVLTPQIAFLVTSAASIGDQ